MSLSKWLQCAYKNTQLTTPLLYHGRSLSYGHSKMVNIATDESNFKPKPFSEIPRVKNPVKTIFNFLTGKYSMKKLHEVFADRFLEYGEIYCDKLGEHAEAVFISNPDDFQTVYTMETRKNPPLRGVVFPFLKEIYRLNDYPLSILNIDGDHWLKIRDSLKPILLPSKMAKLVPNLSQITNEFFDSYLEEIMEKEQTNVIKNFEEHLKIWTFECAGMVTFHESLGMFKNYQEIDETVRVLYENTKVALDLITKNELSPLKTYNQKFNTATWKSLYDNRVNAYTALTTLSQSYTQYVVDENSSLTSEEKIAATFDVLTAAVDTISTTTLWATIELALNPDVQEKIYQEIQHVIGNEPITGKTLQKLSYTRGAMKESFRLRPVFIGQIRLTQEKTVLSGYEIPENTCVMMLNNSYDKEKHFPNHTKFQPERWIRAEENHVRPHGYTVIPFGQGMRSCIGKRIAENEIMLYLVKLMKEYKIELLDEDFDVVYGISVRPEKDVDFKFIKRKDQK